MKKKWHKVADNDLPKEGGNYWCKLKGEYHQGSSHYKQHCNNGYCILQWLPKKKMWNVRYNTEVEAWIELPKYDEQFETEKQSLINKACEWLSNNIEYYTDTQNDSEGNLCEVILENALIRDFRKLLKGE